MSKKPNEQRYGPDYLKSLKVGERVIETGRSCMRGATGVVYRSKNKGTYRAMCVLWDLPDGKMGTSITHGTRRITDVLKEHDDAVQLAWGVIANAGGGDWKTQSRTWQQAAKRWRDRFVV